MQILEKIGEGLTCEIKKCQIDNKLYALKVYKECHKKLREKEIKIMNSISQKNIISLKTYDEEFNWFITDLMDCDLYQIVSKKGRLDNKQVKYIVMEIAQGLNYLHSINYAHRDIKLENIMINKDQVKIVDFGLSESIDTNKMYSRHCGTITYMAPELHKQEKQISGVQLKQTDVFSLGVLIFILMYGCPPFQVAIQEKCQFWKTIQQGKWQQFWKYFDKQLPQSDENFKELIQKLLEPDNAKRYTIQELIQHRWINDN